jgi:hypothetical protein
MTKPYQTGIIAVRDAPQILIGQLQACMSTIALPEGWIFAEGQPLDVIRAEYPELAAYLEKQGWKTLPDMRY